MQHRHIVIVVGAVILALLVLAFNLELIGYGTPNPPALPT
jgi:hypothetical protein